MSAVEPTWLEVELRKHDRLVYNCPCNLCALATIFHNEWTINQSERRRNYLSEPVLVPGDKETL